MVAMVLLVVFILLLSSAGLTLLVLKIFHE